MNRKYFEDFASPASQFRGKPFWAWNGKLEEDELRRQIRIFHKMGFGGFFMHARIGLDTPYLGREWFDCVKACINEARKFKMEAWLYDEDCWPSGVAGGKVTENPDNLGKALVLEKFERPSEFQWSPDIIAAFAAKIEGKYASNVEQLDPKKKPNVVDGSVILSVKKVTSRHLPDRMRPDVVKQFLKLTHQAYAKEVGEEFGKSVPGIFTDEPTYNSWTDKLPEIFKKRYKYDLIPRLLELYYNVDGEKVSQARYHYHDCLTYLFADSFGRLIGEWCEKHNLAYTGHLAEEDSLMAQTRSIGSAMRFLEYMQIPGIDLLMEHCRIYNTAKQCSSVANQMGRQRRMSEMYGCTGWDLSFEAHKAMGDWQAACGINLRVPHLSWYTMLAEAKRDYPASISYQSPWWEFYDKVEGYFARIHAAMQNGVEVRDLLVIHPVESLWALRTEMWREDPEVIESGNNFDDLVMVLMSKQIDFDYGDEDLLSRYAKVGKNGGEAIFRVGKAKYKAVLVPPLKTIRSTTLNLLKKFATAGGLVVFVGDAPEYMDAVASEEPAGFAKTCKSVPSVDKEMASAVEETCSRITITDTEGCKLPEAIYLLKEDAKAFYLFVCNTSYLPAMMKGTKVRTGNWRMLDELVRERHAAYPHVRIRGFGGCQGKPFEMDAESGKMFATDSLQVDGKWEIRTSLPRVSSRIFVIPKDKADVPNVSPRPRYVELSGIELNPHKWDISLSEDNCLVLDSPRYKVGNGQWHERTEILKVDTAVRESMNIARRGHNMVQPWKRPTFESPKSVPVTLRYEFDVQYIPSGNLRLGLEQPQEFDITVNGHSISTDSVSGWWTDKSLQTLPIDPAYLKLGRNEIVLSLAFKETFSGLEIMYLLGDFGTRINGTEVSVTAPPAALKLGDWCEQGLSFYGGSVSYMQKIQPELKGGQRLVVKLGDYRGVAVRILVNGKSAGIIGWEPNELDVTDCVSDAEGEVELAIEVIGHRRNSHGPLHLNEKWPHWTGPSEFVPGPERWYDNYQLVPVGLMTPPSLLVRGL